MSVEGKARLYRLKVGTKIYENLTSAVIRKNIMNGKLKPQHQLAPAGTSNWVNLGKIKQLAPLFDDPLSSSAPAGPDSTTPGPVVPPPPAYQQPVYAQQQAYPHQQPQVQQPMGPPGEVYMGVRKNGEEMHHVPRTHVIQLIRKGELNETDEVLMPGYQDWGLAGDEESLRHYFDMRRQVYSNVGYDAVKDLGKPFYFDFVTPFKFFANKSFLFNLLGILIFFTIANLAQIPIIKGPILILTNLYVYAYFFRVAYRASDGDTKFPEFSDLSDFGSEIIRPMGQYFLSRVFAMLPLLGYLVYKMWGIDMFAVAFYIFLLLTISPWIILVLPVPVVSDQPIMQFDTETITQGAGQFTDSISPDMGMFDIGFEFLTFDILVWLALIFSLIYFPIAIMRQASYGEFMPTLNLPAVFMSIGRAFGPFCALIGFLIAIDILGAILLGILGIMMGVSSIVGSAAGGQAGMLLPLPFEILMQAVVWTFAFLKMFYIGRFLFQNSKRMGWA